MDPTCVELGPFPKKKGEIAVCVRKACKAYGIKKNKTIILSGLNMTVEKGTIYGLLGSSGCGKTTLLTCIVGRRKLNTGTIWVLGGHPGEPGSGVPGPRVGYMPQDIALLKELTIIETFKYFGWIAGLKNSYIKKRTNELVSFLELPDPHRRIGQLSGGQQRRASFAAALLHDPELLILDEPTVGVDPVLRQNIWEYLVEVTAVQKKTVIITTHYIDECKQAQRIGLMRGGVLLAEETPMVLMQRFQCDNLEEAYLKLSVRQQRQQDKTDVVPALDFKQSEFHEVNDNMENLMDLQVDSNSLYEYNTDAYEGSNTRPKLRHHLKALVWKNILWIQRNVPIMLFLFALPVVQIVLFCTTIGRDPKNLHLAIYNEELKDSQSCDPFISRNNSCDMTMLSCKYLDHLLNKTTYKQDRFKTLAEARKAVKRGKAWGVLHFNHNYSNALVQRIELGNQASEDIVSDADMNVVLDMSNQAIGHLLSRDIALEFLEFIRNVLRRCQWNPRVVDIPIDFRTPVYGTSYPRFLDFSSPGSILAMIFILAAALTAGSILAEKLEGTVERCLVAGVTMQEVLMSHIIVETCIMAGQVSAVLVFAFAVFDISNEGSWLLVVILSLLEGVNGMCLGYLLSTIFDNQVLATLAGLGYFLIILFISGVLWPIEGMHWTLKNVVLFSPMTTATESMRGVMLRGWSFTKSVVYLGFISTIIWIGIYLFLTLLAIKLKKALN